MKDLVKKLREQIDSLNGDAYFYDMQIKFITYLKETSPEVESEMGGETFDEILAVDRLMKEKILQQIAALNVELKGLTNQKAS
ncbi:hypothetical protein IJ707_06375 [bacterium]|nr:hypothetical protein [bacterium]